MRMRSENIAKIAIKFAKSLKFNHFMQNPGHCWQSRFAEFGTYSQLLWCCACANNCKLFRSAKFR